MLSVPHDIATGFILLPIAYLLHIMSIRRCLAGRIDMLEQTES